MVDIKKFFELNSFAVYGVSKDENKYGTKSFKHLKNKGKKVYPINPKNDEIFGEKCYKTILDIPDEVQGVSVVVPPLVTRKIADDIIKKGSVKIVWMQPGAEDDEAIKKLEENGIDTVYNQCVLLN